MHLYLLNDLYQASVTPTNIFSELAKSYWNNPFLLTSYAPEARTSSANWEMLERLTRNFQKPSFSIDEITVESGADIEIEEQVIAEKDFCHLIRFYRRLDRSSAQRKKSEDLPKLLIVAPLTGHYATLLRDTVRALLPYHDVYITDWINARDVPYILGPFTLDDYVDYLMDFLQELGPNTHVMGVCQPVVPVLTATAIMAAHNNPCTPKSMILMGGPVDTRINPTEVNRQAEQKSLSWFEENVITTIPPYYKGFMRQVCPGFLMIRGFMSMNLDRHISSYWQFYQHLVEGDDSSATAHRKFYDEFLSVLDMPAEYYLDSVEIVFQKHLLPKNKMRWRGEKVDLHAIKKTSLLCIEGERDDISGVGQTKAALDICKNIPSAKKHYHLQDGAGHYGIFNGTRWRTKVMPVIRDFIAHQ